MGNNTYFYFGAFLKVELQRVKVPSPYVWCGTEGHDKQYQWHEEGFCRYCGHALRRMPDVMSYPSFSSILPDEYVDYLLEAHAPKRSEGGIIYIRAGNIGDDGTTWLQLAPHDEDEEEKEFPTPEEIEIMKLELLDNYSDAIKAIRANDNVVEITVCCGYIMDAEI